MLDAAIEQGIEVLGLTPHSANITPGTSAVWAIIKQWRTGTHALTGRAYNELVYAVFPGFEPSFADGNKGIHLIFLFDPSIGQERYESAFSGIMRGRQSWTGKRLDHSTLDLQDAFAVLDDRKVVGVGRYVVVAPHPLQANGLFHRPGPYITDLAAGCIQAAELRREGTLAEDLASNGKLRHAHVRGRVALYHASDAIGLSAAGGAAAARELGHRFALVKLASPRIEALRQAFLARESRLRVPFVRDAAGRFTLGSSPPDPCPSGLAARPWIRGVHVEGGASFLRDQRFRFSSDLTCVIGGSMTGKSTLLDGLRHEMCAEADMPSPRTSLGKAIAARVRERFLSGNPTVTLKSPAGDPSLQLRERMQARFFSQGELESLAEDDEGIEHLLFHLVPGRSEHLLEQRDQLLALDVELSVAAGNLARLQDQLAEAEQAFKRTQDAREAMEAFAEAGTAALPPAQQDLARTRQLVGSVGEQVEAAEVLVTGLEGLQLPTLNQGEVTAPLVGSGGSTSAVKLLEAARAHALAAQEALRDLRLLAKSADGLARARLKKVTQDVQAALVARGRSASDLNQFEAFAKTAQHYESFKAVNRAKNAELEVGLQRYEDRWRAREELVTIHRNDVLDVCKKVSERFEGRVVVDLENEGRRAPLEKWISGLRHAGVSRWWNSGGATTTTPTSLRPALAALSEGKHKEAAKALRSPDVGMSVNVARSFLEQLAPWARQLELNALRCPDRYLIRWVEDGEPKDLHKLSGGRRVAVLLSLVLESDDVTPLIIDQPEDQLDNRFLNETIIPALHRLKGKRQVIFATHNANLVVNGDADQVIALEADAEHGRIYAEGAIEDRKVREAILRTLDGGEAAFRLRRAKYGF